jgi:hypothetical protein
MKTQVIVDESAPGSAALLQELSQIAETERIDSGTYNVLASESDVEEVTFKYPLAVLKVNEL